MRIRTTIKKAGRGALGAGSVAALAAGAVAASPVRSAHPHGNANYIDHHKPALTLWMRTRTRMTVFACYKHGGDHLNNVNLIIVKSNGSFTYDGPARNLEFKTATLKIAGRFVSTTKALGTFTAPCARSHHFTAIYAPAAG